MRLRDPRGNEEEERTGQARPARGSRTVGFSCSVQSVERRRHRTMSYCCSCRSPEESGFVGCRDCEAKRAVCSGKFWSDALLRSIQPPKRVLYCGS